MSTPREWSKAYARQAKADIDTWFNLKGNAAIPECHKPLFLQMACEKLAKAHLCKAGSSAKDLQKSHGYTGKHLPAVVRDQTARSRVNPKQTAWILQHAKQLAQEIELLAPAVKRGGQRPANCEYPWEDDAGKLHVPLDWTFAPSALVATPAGRAFLKLIREAINRFL